MLFPPINVAKVGFEQVRTPGFYTATLINATLHAWLQKGINALFKPHKRRTGFTPTIAFFFENLAEVRSDQVRASWILHGHLHHPKVMALVFETISLKHDSTHPCIISFDSTSAPFHESSPF